MRSFEVVTRKQIFCRILGDIPSLKRQNHENQHENGVSRRNLVCLKRWLRHATHCVLPVSIPTIIPLPGLPDKVAASVSSRNIHRAAIEESSPKTNHRDSTTCENPLQLQARLASTCKMQLSWFWVRELRMEDPILDWEKMKRSMSDGLLLKTPKNNNSSVTMRTLLPDSSWETYLFDKEMLLARIPFTQCSNTTWTPQPKPPYQYFQRKKVLFQVFHYHFVIKGCDSRCVWMYYDEMEKWLLRGM
ncbi:unnamed protein product [Trifolium pratense]|uniref:Uncharacterized protein n=1 Tax=Trifolium pratense TaxID=57577 RepID=A0ACB0K364_TRIPR|nr:unnamed protein product [Trifolium pratense]